MANAIGLYNGISFKAGAKQSTYYDLNSEGGMLTATDYNSKSIDSIHDKMRQQQPVPNAMYEKAFNRSTAMMVLGAKTESNSVINGRVELDRNAGLQPPSGYMRNQQKGLVYDVDKPIDLENIMPIANNFFQDSHNVLGNLR
jgi:hypothetical protein